MLSISVLGPVEIRVDGGVRRVPAGKPTELLVRLALDAGRPVSVDGLIDDLWGADADATERNTLQAKVSALRRALGDSGLVVSGPGGYTLDVPPELVDAHVVREAAERVRALVQSSDWAAALAASEDAVGRFRGLTFSGAGDAAWVEPHRAQYDEVRWGLVEAGLQARLGLGDHPAVVAEAERLVAVQPLREGLWALLVTALYRAGRQSDALEAYRRVRDLLGEELGLDPGPELRELERQVLDQSLPLAAPVPAPVDATARSAAPAGGNLPALSSALVGRKPLLAELLALTGERRLVTLVGPGGVGKTRLAVELGRQSAWAGRSWLVRLESARTATDLVAAGCAAYGLANISETALADRLRAEPTLLILDNCEHVVDAAADLAGRLLAAAGGLTVLATSQVPLGVDGEEVVDVPPLSEAAAVELFVSRARGRRTVDTPDAGAAVSEVCRVLDGLPLAIELAAARTKSLSVAEIARRLDDRFALLSDPTGRRDGRHRALRATLAWSYDLLFPDDQIGLWALSVFAGSASLAAAETVAAALGVPPDATTDVFARLVERSLVVVDEDPDGTVRYRLLDSVRAYAADRLAEAGQADVARAAHAEWLTAAAELARAEERGPRLADQVAISVAERANVDSALRWASTHDPALGVRLAIGFGWTSVILGEGATAADRLRRALAADETAGPTARAVALALAAWDEAAADLSRAEQDADQSAAYAVDSGDQRAAAAAAFAQAFVRMQQGRPDELRAGLDAWAAGPGANAGRWDQGLRWALTGYAALMGGDLEGLRLAAAAAQSANAELVGDESDGWLSSQVEAVLGHLAMVEGRAVDAVAHLGRAVAHAEQVGLPATVAFHLAALGPAQLAAGEAAAAVTTMDRAIETARAAGNLRIVATAQVRLAPALIAQGQLDRARAELEAALDWFDRSGGGAEADAARALLATLG